PELDRVKSQIAEHGFADRVHVVEGGEKRQESVANALLSLPAEPDDIVLVHDAVRPLIDSATIERTIDAVVEHGAAIVGLPAVDTIKQVERTAHGFVGTDEASLVERAGHPVVVVHGSAVNLKITQPGDLELAEFYLHQQA